MDELIVPRFPVGIACIECEEKDAKIFATLYDHITHAYCKKQFLTRPTPSVQYAKGLVKDYEYTNSFVNYPVDFIQKGKYVIVIRKDSPNYGLIKDIPNTSHAAELLLSYMYGGDEVMNYVLESRKLGVEPKFKMNYKTGEMEMRFASKED